MNVDLKRRLTLFKDITQNDWEFLYTLRERFITETAKQYLVRVCYENIEGNKDDTAYVTFEDGLFTLVLDQRLSFGTICDYMIHEYAHIGTWFVNEKDEHGPHFGVEYARLYRIYLNLYERWF